MECLWGLFGYRQPHGHRNQQNPAVLHVCFRAYNGLADYSVYGAGFLAEYAPVYVGR